LGAPVKVCANTKKASSALPHRPVRHDVKSS
jgi:hypothetical protein